MYGNRKLCLRNFSFIDITSLALFNIDKSLQYLSSCNIKKAVHRSNILSFSCISIQILYLSKFFFFRICLSRQTKKYSLRNLKSLRTFTEDHNRKYQLSTSVETASFRKVFLETHKNSRNLGGEDIQSYENEMTETVWIEAKRKNKNWWN